MRRSGSLTALVAALCVLAAGAVAGAAGPNSWSPAAAMGVPRLDAVFAPLPNGRVLVAGGSDTSGTVLKSAEIYTVATNSWSPAADMSTARELATATALPDGDVLVAGGATDTNPNSAMDSAEVYHPASNSWTSVSNTMADARERQTATLLPSGKVLIAGGNDTTPTTLATADLYDPGTNSFTPAAPMGTRRLFAGAALLSSGKVLVAGGSSDLSGASLDSGETYDPASNSWTPVANAMPGGARLDPNTAPLPGGRALVAGGAVSGEGGAVLSTADVYDSATNRFTAAANAMSSPRIGGLAVPLVDGRVLVAGGETASSPETAPSTASADLFDPASATFSPAASMGTARTFPAFARLDDGRVLVAGGGTNLKATGTVASAELYQPTTIPAAPGGAHASPEIGAALVSWQPPGADGGAPVLRYRITVSPGGQTIDTPDARLSTSVPGLQNGRAYTFSVTAINAVGVGPASQATNSVKPTKRILSALKLSPKAFVPAARGPSARAAARHGKKKAGAIVRYKLIEPARVTFTVQRLVRGVRHGKRCVKPRGHGGRRCTRVVRVRGSFALKGVAGANKFRFTGRLRRHALPRGSYRLVATPKETAGATGSAVRVRFTIR